MASKASVEETSTPTIDHTEGGPILKREKSPTHILYHGDQGLSVEFIRTDLINFWRGADETQRSDFATDIALDVATIEWAIDGVDVGFESWEAIRSSLAIRQNASV